MEENDAHVDGVVVQFPRLTSLRYLSRDLHSKRHRAHEPPRLGYISRFSLLNGMNEGTLSVG